MIKPVGLEIYQPQKRVMKNPASKWKKSLLKLFHCISFILLTSRGYTLGQWTYYHICLALNGGGYHLSGKRGGFSLPAHKWNEIDAHVLILSLNSIPKSRNFFPRSLGENVTDPYFKKERQMLSVLPWHSGSAGKFCFKNKEKTSHYVLSFGFLS